MIKGSRNFSVYGELQRIWLERVMKEYRQICIRHAVPLKVPVFALHRGEKSLGIWRREIRQLSLSELLFQKYSWWEVEQVLRHEMAHQLVDELPELLDAEDSDGRRTHGEVFLQACEFLGVAAAFRKPSVLREEEMRESLSWRKVNSDRDLQLLQRIEKVFALGQSANEFEAERAMEKAQEMLEKYHLSRLRSEQTEHVCTVINLKRSNVALWQKYLCALLQEFFMVQVVMSWTFDCLSGKDYRAVELFGTSANVVVAEYCFHFVSNQLISLWKRDLWQFGPDSRKHHNSYCVGVVLGFYDKLKDRKKYRERNTKESGESFALVVLEEKRLTSFVANRYPGKMRTVRGRGRVVGESCDRGRKVGRELDFVSGLGEKGGGYFLP